MFSEQSVRTLSCLMTPPLQKLTAGSLSPDLLGTVLLKYHFHQDYSPSQTPAQLPPSLPKYFMGSKSHVICKGHHDLNSSTRLLELGSKVVSSVAQFCPILCDPMDWSMPGFPIHHQLPELAQTHVHRVSDAIQPSHPLSSPFSPVFNLSQHQGLFKRVSPSHQVAKVLEHQSFQ